MATPFSQTTRALQADRFRRSGWLMALGLVLLAAWGGWLMLARVSVYIVSESARLEAGRAVHLVEAPVEGRVAAVQAVLGQEVEAGAVLLVLDATAEHLHLEEARARLAALEAQVEALRREQATGEQALRQAHQAGAASLDEIRARYVEADAAARLAEGDAERIRRLFEKQYVSAAEHERATAEARQKRAAAAALQQRLRGTDYSRRQEDSDRRVRLDQVHREIARLEGEAATTTATIERLTNEIDRRTVRAPVAGRIGELAEVHPGAFIEAGDRLGAVVPEGALRVVAHFIPSEAAGRIAPGQDARLRLDGFPWTQYGSVAVVVERVADEVKDGRVRVELRVQPGSAPLIPLQHGLPGTLEVQVERTAPAALVLRQVGKRLQS